MSRGHERVVRLLRESGTNPSLHGGMAALGLCGLTWSATLVSVVACAHEAAIAFCCLQSADQNARERCGRKPLMIAAAAASGDLSTAQYLLNGPDIDREAGNTRNQNALSGA
ncbi:hypothetical protein BO82DRAFT_403536 [Aspergillus uvarum CBS 121591]|uniref:Ankyrin n=1 Tax=Aspergillus uvarum CBS 121591 TaxID=1448315 RepID=A0A319C570_9EURO|nr:hypothetical protein BO82DRAFT_403536 [Aspergillus uvarum CBS 121591]PYH80304.1 hypothetical protein BO82DRAFT_403536 [Aspergillus uvarum CBS 121591]